MRSRDPKLVAAAVLAYSLLALLISAVMAHAETTVGMQAQGIDAWTAWHNSNDLDVRDELNRPVSARLIESQVKDGMTRAEGQTTFSSLPHAKQAIAWLENWRVDFADIRSYVPFPANRRVEALPWIRRPLQESVLWIIPIYLFTLCAALNVLTSGLVFNRREACLSIPLRC